MTQKSRSKYALKQASSTRYSWVTSYVRHSVMLSAETLEMRKRVFKSLFLAKSRQNAEAIFKTLACLFMDIDITKIVRKVKNVCAYNPRSCFVVSNQSCGVFSRV